MAESSLASRSPVARWLDQPADGVLRELNVLVAGAESRGDQVALAQGLTWLGQVLGSVGDAHAEAVLQRAQAKAISTGNDVLLCQAMLAQARHDADRGQYARSLAECRRAADMARAQGWPELVRQALFISGTALCHIGEHDLALESFEEAHMLLRANPESLSSGNYQVDAGRYAAAQAQAWLMRGGLLLEAGGQEAAADALQRARQLGERACAALLGASPRFSHAALFGLVRVLLEGGEVGEARAWMERVEAQMPLQAWRGSLARAHWLLSEAMICLRSGDGDFGALLERLREVEAVQHPRVVGGDLHLSLLRCQYEVNEQAGRFAEALACQRHWLQAKARLRGVLAREHSRWTEDTLLALRTEAGEFVTGQLREPLARAMESLGKLVGDADTTDLQVCVMRAQRSVRRAIDIADQYLSVMRAEHLRWEDLQLIDLALVVDDISDQMAPPTSSSVRLVREIERPLHARGDRLLLMRALGNLMSNAFKHAPAGTSVRVCLANRSDGVWLSVADEGPGLPLDMRVRLFQRFASGAVRNGNGLGLAMVARAARVHRARIVVDSEPGQGTTVSLVLGTGDGS